MLPPQLFKYLLDATMECADTLSTTFDASEQKSDTDTASDGTGSESTPQAQRSFDRALAIHKFRIAYAAVVVSLLAGYDRFIHRGSDVPDDPDTPSPSHDNQEDMSFDTEEFLQYKRDKYAADEGAVEFMTVRRTRTMFGVCALFSCVGQLFCFARLSPIHKCLALSSPRPTATAIKMLRKLFRVPPTTVRSTSCSQVSSLSFSRPVHLRSHFQWDIELKA